MENFHFIGIAGTSMRALAEIMFLRGYSISGTDKIIPREIDSNILCFINKQFSQVPDSTTCVVYNNLVAEDNPDLLDAKKRNIPTIPRGAFLNQITNDRFKFLITGTDGKTSTSFYLYQLAALLDLDPFALIGADIDKHKCYKIGKGPYVVEHNEGDLTNCVDDSDVLIFTNFDQKDHLWNFNYSIELFFDLYAQLMKKAKLIIYNIDDEGVNKIVPLIHNKISFGQNPKADFRIQNIEETIGFLNFELVFQQKTYEIKNKLHGFFSAYNVTAAIIATFQQIPNLDLIISQTKKLKHANSRFEIVQQDEKKTIISSMHGSGKSLGYVVESLKKHNKPISIVINFSEERGRLFFDEFYDVLKHHRFACFSGSYIAKQAPEAFLIASQEDFNKFLDETDGICLIAHAKYCFHTYLKNYVVGFESCFG